METKSGRDHLFSILPPPSGTDMKKLHKFFSQMGHITMEKADLKNATKWFAECRDKGFLPAMDYHREGVRGVFGMENYDEWRKGFRFYEVEWYYENDEEEELSKSLPKIEAVPNDIMEDDAADWISDIAGMLISGLTQCPPPA